MVQLVGFPPDLAVGVQGSTAVQMDVLASKEPERRSMKRCQ